MSDNQISDLAKAILAGDRITPTTGVPQSGSSTVNGTVIPKGAVPITEGAQIIWSTAENQSIPQGGKTVNFSKDEEKGE